MPEPVKILVVGQTPPPVHGQAIMIQRLLQAKFARVRLFHVRMAFSKSIGDVGRFRIGKLWHLMAVIAQIIYHRIAHRVDVLYYPPAGPRRVPLYRDLVILGCTRWMFRRTVFHFHASGISQLYPQLNPLIRLLFRRAFFHPDVVVRITREGPDDSGLLQPRRVAIVPNGIDDDLRRSTTNSTQEWVPGLRILFVGILREPKGLMVLIEACALLQSRGVLYELCAAGEFESPEFEARVEQRIAELGLTQRVRFLGSVQGNAKAEAFAWANAFCLPTYHESETFPTVLLEAMSCALPVVATRWRGIPEIVDDGVTGFLVPVHDPVAVADRLEQLHDDVELRRRMSAASRAKYLREFTIERHLERFEEVFVDVAANDSPATAIAEVSPRKNEVLC